LIPRTTYYRRQCISTSAPPFRSINFPLFSKRPTMRSVPERSDRRQWTVKRRGFEAPHARNSPPPDACFPVFAGKWLVFPPDNLFFARTACFSATRLVFAPHGLFFRRTTCFCAARLVSASDNLKWPRSRQEWPRVDPDQPQEQVPIFPSKAQREAAEKTSTLKETPAGIVVPSSAKIIQLVPE